MALRGRTLSILLNPTVAGELDDFEKFAPAQLEMRNGVRTLGGAWRRRPGYEEWKGTQILNADSPILGLADYDDHLLCVSENGTIIAIGENSQSLGQYDREVGQINVGARPQFAYFSGAPVIIAGGTPKIMYRGAAVRLGLEIDKPDNSPTLLDWGTGDPFPGSQTGEDPPYGGGIGGTQVVGVGGSDPYRGGPQLEQVAEGAGSIGPSHGRWVYGYSYLTVNGETQVGPPSDFVNILTPNEGVRVVVPGTDHPFVTARSLYRARFYGKGQASVWRRVEVLPGRSRVEYYDQVVDAKLGITELPYNTAESLAPEGSRFVAVLGDYIVVAGHDRYSFAFCQPRNWLSWPVENYRQVDASSGPITAVAAMSGSLVVFCRHAIEVWGVLGGQQPFTQRQKLDVGSIAPYGVVNANGGHFFVGENRELYHLAGGLEAVSVGNRDWFLDIDTPENIYAIHFPYERRIRYFSRQKSTVLVYDYATQHFSYESTSDPRGDDRIVGIISGHPYLNQMIVGSRSGGDLYKWSDEFATDNGTPIRVVRRLRVMLTPTGNRCRCQRILLRMKRTDTTQPGPIRPPFVRVSWALDGCGSDRQELYVNEDCHGPYAEICAPGVGRELVLEIVEEDTFDYMLTHAFVSVVDLGR